jgi:hypothetical protein
MSPVRTFLLVPVVLVLTGLWLPSQNPDPQEIVRRSVALNELNWQKAPQFSYTRHEVFTEGDKVTDRTYKVVMVNGSPREQLLAENGKPLPAERLAQERRKLETARASPPSDDSGDNRGVAAYQQGRQQHHALMQEMPKAFEFQFVGEEVVKGRNCFVLEASPRPGYQAPSKDTKVLTGMRGKLWIDAREYQWVKVQAEVFKPVAFGLFIAHVRPGTEFLLEQEAVTEDVWLPSHFVTKLRSTKLVFFSKAYTRDETYSDFQRQTPR